MNNYLEIILRERWEPVRGSRGFSIERKELGAIAQIPYQDARGKADAALIAMLPELVSVLHAVVYADSASADQEEALENATALLGRIEALQLNNKKSSGESV
jgi:hypothetical protein